MLPTMRLSAWGTVIKSHMLLLSTCLGLQLFSYLEADDEHQVVQDELVLALLGWLHLGQSPSAHAAWQRYGQLTTKLTAGQQQKLFKAALSLKGQRFDPAAVAMAKDLCMLAAKSQRHSSPEQTQQLIQALLARGRLQDACMVSRWTCSCII